MDPMPLAGTWRDEEWARNVARLDQAERTRRINAVPSCWMPPRASAIRWSQNCRF